MSPREFIPFAFVAAVTLLACSTAAYGLEPPPPLSYTTAACPTTSDANEYTTEAPPTTVACPTTPACPTTSDANEYTTAAPPTEPPKCWLKLHLVICGPYFAAWQSPADKWQQLLSAIQVDVSKVVDVPAAQVFIDAANLNADGCLEVDVTVYAHTDAQQAYVSGRVLGLKDATLPSATELVQVADRTQPRLVVVAATVTGGDCPPPPTAAPTTECPTTSNANEYTTEAPPTTVECPTTHHHCPSCPTTSNANEYTTEAPPTTTACPTTPACPTTSNANEYTTEAPPTTTPCPYA